MDGSTPREVAGGGLDGPPPLLRVMASQRDLLHRLVFKLTELSLMLRAGHADLLVAAVDEVEDLQTALGVLDLERALLTPVPGEEDHREACLSDVASALGPPWAEALSALGEEMRGLLAEAERERATAHRLAAERQGEVDRGLGALAAIGADGYKEDGTPATSPSGHRRPGADVAF